MAGISKPGTGTGRTTNAGFDGAAGLFGDVQRCADFDPVVRLHGLPRRARESDRKVVQEPAPCHGKSSWVTRRGDCRDLRGLRHRDRNRRRSGDIDGLAGVTRNAQGRLSRQACRRRDYRRWLPWHPDSAVRVADRIRRNGRRIGREALCRRFFPRHHARRTLCGLHHHRRKIEAQPGTTVVGRRPNREAAEIFRVRFEVVRRQRPARSGCRTPRQGQCRCADPHATRTAIDRAVTSAGVYCGDGLDLSHGDGTARSGFRRCG